MPTRTVTVDLGPRSYDVAVGPGILVELGPRLRHLTAARSVLVVRDDGLPDDLIERAEASLHAAGLAAAWCTIHASERDKSMATAQRIVEAAAAARLERADAFVALGGGVIGDLAGFAASIYRRGIAVIQCPTTLLAMVDASVGGKTAVNLIIPGAASPADDRLLKNMAGTFHQPRLVLADVAALTSLPLRHLRAGLAECIKHAMLAADVGDPALITEIEHLIPAIARAQASPETLTPFIARNIAIKAAVVAGDELESGSMSPDAAPATTPAHAGREALNLGHTFGHALESLEHLSPDADPANAPLHHGEAVALGLIAATATAESLGQVPAGSTDTIRRTVESAGLPTRITGLPADDVVIAAMMDDKKVKFGRLRLVLPHGQLGRVRIADNPDPAHVAAGLASIRT